MQDVSVSVDQETSLDVKLQLGDLSETVEVTAGTPLLKTERSDVATTFSEKTVASLPILNRRFTAFELLTPGVQATTSQTASSEDPQGSYRKVVNGQSFAGSAHLLDGTDNHDALLGLIVVNPTLESVTEAKVTTANYDAEFGATAGVISAQTKSGTNSFHGALSHFLRNDVFNARNPFTQFQKIPGTDRYIPVTQWNQFGGALGGPVVKNAVFFFGGLSGDAAQHRRFGAAARTVGGRTPGRPQRPGRRHLRPGRARRRSQTASSSPETGFRPRAFPRRRRICSSSSRCRTSKAPCAISPTTWAPARSGSMKTSRTPVGTTSQRTDAFFRPLQPGRLPDGLAGNIRRARGRARLRRGGAVRGRLQNPQPEHRGRVRSRRSVRTWLTDFRFGWFRYRVNVDPGGGDVNPATDAGIPGLNIDDFSRGMPAFLLNGYGPGGNTGNQFNFGYALQFARCNCPLRQNERQFQFVNNWTKLQGNHTIKFGADIRHARNLRIPSDRHRAGELQFNAARTQGPTGGGSALASFLLGDVSVFERYVSSVTDAEERQNRWFFYGQDQWKATRKLTINYGLRWEIYRPQTVTGAGKGGFVDVDTGEVLIAGSEGVGLDLNVEGTLKTLGAAPGHRLPRHRQHRAAHGLRPRLRHRHLRFGLRAQRDAEPAGAGDSVAAAAAQLRCGLQLSRRGRRRWIRRRFSADSRPGRTGVRCCPTV